MDSLSDWLRDIDFSDPKYLDFFDTGYVLFPLYSFVKSSYCTGSASNSMEGYCLVAKGNSCVQVNYMQAESQQSYCISTGSNGVMINSDALP